MKVYFTDDDELTVAPLTDDEQKWIKRLQRTLDACPDRLELVTIGDADLSIVDKDGARESELADGAAGRDGIVLSVINGKPLVHGVSG